MIPLIQKIENIKDFDEIEKIEMASFMDPFSKDVYIYDFEHHPYSEYYKLIIDHIIIGFFGLWVIDDTAQITTIAVYPSKQNQGYGQIMMDFIIHYLKELNCTNITLEVRVSNAQAIHFYEKNHFEKVALRKRYYENGEDAYLMKCDL